MLGSGFLNRTAFDRAILPQNLFATRRVASDRLQRGNGQSLFQQPRIAQDSMGMLNMLMMSLIMPLMQLFGGGSTGNSSSLGNLFGGGGSIFRNYNPMSMFSGLYNPGGYSNSGMYSPFFNSGVAHGTGVNGGNSGAFVNGGNFGAFANGSNSGMYFGPPAPPSPAAVSNFNYSPPVTSGNYSYTNYNNAGSNPFVYSPPSPGASTVNSGAFNAPRGTAAPTFTSAGQTYTTPEGRSVALDTQAMSHLLQTAHGNLGNVQADARSQGISPGWFCYGGVSRHFSKAFGSEYGTLTGGAAWMGADQLANMNNVTEIGIPADLTTLPDGCILVWPPTSGNQWGHIGIKSGEGEYSDIWRDNLIDSRNKGVQPRAFVLTQPAGDGTTVAYSSPQYDQDGQLIEGTGKAIAANGDLVDGETAVTTDSETLIDENGVVQADNNSSEPQFDDCPDCIDGDSNGAPLDGGGEAVASAESTEGGDPPDPPADEGGSTEEPPAEESTEEAA